MPQILPPWTKHPSTSRNWILEFEIISTPHSKDGMIGNIYSLSQVPVEGREFISSHKGKILTFHHSPFHLNHFFLKILFIYLTERETAREITEL